MLYINLVQIIFLNKKILMLKKYNQVEKSSDRFNGDYTDSGSSVNKSSEYEEDEESEEENPKNNKKKLKNKRKKKKD